MTICYDVFWSSSPWALIIYTTYTPSMLPHPSTGNRSLALLYDSGLQKMAKTAILEPLKPPKLISRKI